MDNDKGNTDAPGSRSLKYLTVQDMLWINLQATKKVQHFRYAMLEEATYYQYGYGTSHDLAIQAGRFLSGFMKLRPFDAGNVATAFIGCVAFLTMNCARLNLSDEDATQWVKKVRSGSARAEESMPIGDRECHGHPVKVADAVEIAFQCFPNTIDSLLRETEAAAVG